MTHWWRAYDDAIDHPKLLRLSDAMHRAWWTLQCIASANGGTLPPAADIALRLRLKASKVAEWIALLVAAELLDNNDGVFSPHNWDTRQYKSDVTDPTAPKRMQRYREKKRNERNGAVTLIRPEADSEQIQSRADAPRADLSVSEKVLRTDLMEVFGGSKCPDLARAGIWLSSGYGSSMILDVVRELLARKPDIVSLSYFDAALAERHAKRAPTPSERAATPIDMDSVVKLYALTGVWSRQAGPEPGQIGCRAAADVLAKHGIASDGLKLKTMNA